MYEKKHYLKNTIEIVKVIMIIIATMGTLIFAGYLIAFIDSQTNPIKCTSDSSGERFCKRGNGEWLPQ
jgi:hypothetical protein